MESEGMLALSTTELAGVGGSFLTPFLTCQNHKKKNQKKDQNSIQGYCKKIYKEKAWL